MIIEFLTATSNGVEHWLILVFVLLALAYFPVSQGMLSRAKKTLGRSSITVILLMVATLIYIYFREGMKLMVVVDRIFYTILFATVLLLMFIVWKWKGVTK